MQRSRWRRPAANPHCVHWGPYPTSHRHGGVPSDLSDPTLSQITADQFSVLTPENEMKWQVVEPQQGSFDWTGADNLVAFAEAHNQRVRGHTLVWHNQLPNWLTQGVANGTISNPQLRDLLHQHITTEVAATAARSGSGMSSTRCSPTRIRRSSTQ